MASHSDAVSLPEGDADELPKTMVTPSLDMLLLLSQWTSKALNSTRPTYIGGNAVDVLGDTSTAERALIADGTHGGSCLGGLVVPTRPERALSWWACRG
jgi:hypothetical protein